MLEQFDPTLIAIAIVIWPAAKSIVFLGAAATTLWTRRESRRAAAERILRMLHRHPAADDERRD